MTTDEAIAWLEAHVNHEEACRCRPFRFATSESAGTPSRIETTAARPERCDCTFSEVREHFRTLDYMCGSPITKSGNRG